MLPCVHVSMVPGQLDKGLFDIICCLCMSKLIKTVSQNKIVQDFVEFVGFFLTSWFLWGVLLFRFFL